ncbi:hypothetical protein HPB50_017212 [Hyalomma asiaticum]|uniref:Uncharacterized protein n=1 Tax=Hyalomma asiaticum TaxID=266040 RepID=A0ACB7S843_HYAAI|nr:hypothetical protein HPB50_017212 [Hyalomma asiaticum]
MQFVRTEDSRSKKTQNDKDTTEGERTWMMDRRCPVALGQTPGMEGGRRSAGRKAPTIKGTNPSHLHSHSTTNLARAHGLKDARSRRQKSHVKEEGGDEVGVALGVAMIPASQKGSGRAAKKGMPQQQQQPATGRFSELPSYLSPAAHLTRCKPEGEEDTDTLIRAGLLRAPHLGTPSNSRPAPRSTRVTLRQLRCARRQATRTPRKGLVHGERVTAATTTPHARLAGTKRNREASVRPLWCDIKSGRRRQALVTTPEWFSAEAASMGIDWRSSVLARSPIGVVQVRKIHYMVTAAFNNMPKGYAYIGYTQKREEA